ncbi:MAG: ATP-dependent helicase [Microbacteriaceae bacterium]|nr:ATP-dependent helicase [Microbacteriaceae bacterium]
MSKSSLLEHLDADQLEAVQTISGPLRIIAGAGTGKTRTVTTRIAYGVAEGVFNPEKTMALTYTKKAANELANRLRKYGVVVNARTIHSAALAQLSYFWATHVGGQFPQVREHKAELLTKAAGKLKLDLDRVALREIAAEIEWRKVNAYSIPQYSYNIGQRHLEQAGLNPEIVISMQQEYENQKDYARVIDFEDVLLSCVGMLENERAVLDEVRSRYKHFTIDEYQDTSPVQQLLLELWVGDSRDVAVVGDPNQSIYTFAGSSPKFLLEFDRWFSDAATVTLATNYRSGREILKLANQIISSNSPQSGDLAQAADKIHAPVLVPNTGAIEGSVSFNKYASLTEEAEATVAKIAKLLNEGHNAKDIAVLYRINAQSAAFEQALSQKSMSAVLKGQQPFQDREEVRHAVAFIRQAVYLDAEATLAKIWPEILVSQFSTSEEFLEKFDPLQNEENARNNTLTSLKRLGELIKEDSGKNAKNFLANITADTGQNLHAGVTLSTIHAAKGLEWKTVFLVGATDNLLPFRGEDSAEEKRLAYVGVTRAATDLVISYPSTVDGRQQNLSRYLQPHSS